MKKRKKPKSGLPKIVSQAEWQRARDRLLVKEKASTRTSDALAAERRRLPMVAVEKDYVFTGPRGNVSLLDLFEGRRQLILYHFMYAPKVDGWPAAGCSGCSMMIDQVGHLAHIHARNTSFCIVARAPFARIRTYKRRMGWTIPWVSSSGSDFNADYGLTTAEGETFGLSVFLRDGGRIYRTYFTDGRGVESHGSVWSYLDLTPWGRQEDWEDTPAGRPKSHPFRWWRRHDGYGKNAV